MKQTIDTKIAIQSAVNAFETKSLFEAGTGLFETLGYDTSLQAPLDEKTFAEFNELYVQSSPNVERFSEERAMVSDWKSIDILFQLTDDSFSQNGQLFDSKVNPLNPQSYLCFSVELVGSEWSKTKIAAITREINKLFAIPIIIVFKYGEYITLALINRRANKKDNERDVLEKVTLIKDIVFANPHRAHIEILFDMALENLNKTYEIHNFETLHKAWSEVLDTQTLNKRFYSELSNWYFWAIKTVVYPGYEMEADKNGLFKQEDKIREHNAKNLIRLLTRLLFVWFIKEKDLIPEELFDERKIRELITKFSPDYSAEETSEALEGRSIYYRAILQNLFFASLNAEHGKRAFRIDGQNQNATSLMRYKRYHKDPESFVKLIESKVPFMNGGLFECLDHADEELKGKQGGEVIDYEDGFSDRKDNELFVPDYIFFGKNVSVDLSSEYDDKKKKDVTVNGIINILQKYKFTIAENTPVEEDIALDPELLGRVFENLLASYNPETKTNARKQTGSFYTPRAIVEYMVDESLKAYLKEKIDSVLQIENVEQKLADLIAYNDKEADFSAKEKRFILECIDTCKILDPACGSGAFPMGILQKIVYVIHKLDGDNRNWKAIQADKIEDDKTLTKDEKKALIDDMNAVFDDNELDYARKLYLIEKCIHGIDIQPIATQISRLRFFISLIVDQKVDESKDNFGVRPLPNLENRFVTANSLIGLDGGNVLTSKRTEELMSELQKVRHELFKAKTPKYKKALREKDKEIREELKNELVLSGFGEENAAAFSSWNPYDKNKSADFFDAEWMFGIKDGFDIVIGNPPYIKEYTSKSAFDGFRETSPYYMGKMDLWYGFACHGIDLLKNKGSLCFIAQNNWTTSSGAKLMRKKVLEDSKILQMLDFNTYMIFENADIQTMVMLFEKNTTADKYTFDYRTLLADAEKDDLLSLLKKQDTEKTKYLEPKIDRTALKDKLLTFNGNDDIFEKIANGKLFLLKNEVAQGIVFPQDFLDKKGAKVLGNEFSQGDSVFGLTAETLENLQLSDVEKALIKPYFTSEEIQRYFVLPKNSKWLIYTDSSFKKKEVMKPYPKLKEHLDKYKAIITSDNAPYGLHRAREEHFFKGEKIISLRKCVSKPSFAWCDFDTYVTQTYFVIQTSRWNMKFLTGVLNSKLVAFWLKNKGKMQGSNYQVDKEPLLNIPLPNATAEEQPLQKKIIDLVDKILQVKKADAGADTSAEEAEIDRLVYALYGLSAEEIEAIEGK